MGHPWEVLTTGCRSPPGRSVPAAVFAGWALRDPWIGLRPTLPPEPCGPPGGHLTEVNRGKRPALCTSLLSNVSRLRRGMS